MSHRLVSIFLLISISTALFSASNISSEKSADSSVAQASGSMVSTYENVTTHEGDLIIDGTNTVVIENCTYIQTGDIYVRDWGKLTIRNVTIKINQDYFWQYNCVVEDNGILTIENVFLAKLMNINFDFIGFSKVDINRFSYRDRPMNFRVAQSADVSIRNSRIEKIEISDTPKLEIINSTVAGALCLGFGQEDVVRIYKLEPGTYEYLDLKERVSFRRNGIPQQVRSTLNQTYVEAWHISAHYNSETEISDSTIWGFRIDIRDIHVELDNLGPQFHEYKHIGEITFNRTRTLNIGVGLYEDSTMTCTNSNLTLGMGGRSDASLANVILTDFGASNLESGSLGFDNTTWKFGMMFFSNLFMHGNITFNTVEIRWVSSNITRNYNIIVKDDYGNPVQMANMSIETKDGELLWRGATDTQGRANFNITFNDSNYQDSWTITAIKNGLNSSKLLRFFSDTPVEIMLDNMPPNIRMSQPLNGSKVFGTLQVKGTASDNTELKLWEVTVDSSLLMNASLSSKSYSYSTSLNTRTLVNGTHTLNVTVYDSSGNVNSTSVVIDVQNILEDFDGSGTVNIVDVTFVAIAYGSKPGDVNWNSEADLDKNNEVNIVDVAMVARQFGKLVE